MCWYGQMSDGITAGRGAPGQKRYCPLCKDDEGNAMPLAGNHNAVCPWCKKCWFYKLKVGPERGTETKHTGCTC